MRWIGFGTVVGLIFSLGFVLWAEPIEITGEEQLLQVLELACALATDNQTASQTLCAQLGERLREELGERLREHGVVRLDPELLGEALAWEFQWRHEYQFAWGLEEALQLVLGLVELIDQGAYGEELREILARGRAAGYSPGEVALLVTELARRTTAQTPAEDVLEEALEHLEELLEEIHEQALGHEEAGEEHGESPGREDHENGNHENGDHDAGKSPAMEHRDHGSGSDDGKDEEMEHRGSPGAEGEDNGSSNSGDEDDEDEGEGEESGHHGHDHDGSDEGNQGKKGK